MLTHFWTAEASELGLGVGVFPSVLYYTPPGEVAHPLLHPFLCLVVNKREGDIEYVDYNDDAGNILRVYND